MDTSENSSSGLRQRKKRARRAALVESAQTLVLARGLDAVTVEDIAAEAGVSARTFFNYFDSKDEAVLGLPGTDIDADVVDTFVAGGPTGEAFDDLVVVARALVSGLAAYKEGMKRSMALAEKEPSLLSQQIAWFDAQKATFAALLEQRIASGAASADPELGSGLLMLLLQNVAVAWGREDCTRDPEQVLDGVIAQLTDLIPPGRSPA
ncbi:TetR/AcrR family transcriptional regulator [Demequina zhanjiangensis]|uniref:Helix-turn-helix domain-containing protein n=1 Tax=Demequina zhanjiangensis TaxID=3051659 RepID=A0ABT8FYF7_9MICO|nr:TetR/AcrR family transcriptional regulator [Demequina sp. SYSU T00b26]MDN4471925.1 helix-turn-helix domain-containing protein [Demequina sp. SYSU T00b26]